MKQKYGIRYKTIQGQAVTYTFEARHYLEAQTYAKEFTSNGCLGPIVWLVLPSNRVVPL